MSEPESMTAVIGAGGYSVRARVYDDRSYGVEPVDILSEPESMTAVIGLNPENMVSEP